MVAIFFVLSFFLNYFLLKVYFLFVSFTLMIGMVRTILFDEFFVKLSEKKGWNLILWNKLETHSGKKPPKNSLKFRENKECRPLLKKLNSNNFCQISNDRDIRQFRFYCYIFWIFDLTNFPWNQPNQLQLIHTTKTFCWCCN